MFYVVDALLRANDKTCTSHDERIKFFRQNYIETGKVQPEFLQWLEEALQERVYVDYDALDPVDSAHADRVLALVPNFLALGRDLLTN